MRNVWRLIAGNLNEAVFGIGLIVLCASVAQWSGPLAGTILGGTLMIAGVLPFIVRRRG
jgi:hypothetical protein